MLFAVGRLDELRAHKESIRLKLDITLTSEDGENTLQTMYTEIDSRKKSVIFSRSNL